MCSLLLDERNVSLQEDVRVYQTDDLCEDILLTLQFLTDLLRQ